MIVLGLDVGDRRIGVAICDPFGLTVRPLSVIIRRSNPQAAEAIRDLVERNEVDKVVVGVPLRAESEVDTQARKILAFVRYLQTRIQQQIETWDERFRTADAEQAMIAMGVRRARRREMIDAAAAAVILDEWLTAHRPPPATTPL